MKTVISLVAFAFFAFNAATMSPDRWDVSVRPLFDMFRTAFIGLATLSLIPVDWTRIGGFLRDKVEAIEPNAAARRPGSDGSAPLDEPGEPRPAAQPPESANPAGDRTEPILP